MLTLASHSLPQHAPPLINLMAIMEVILHVPTFITDAALQPWQKVFLPLSPTISTEELIASHDEFETFKFLETLLRKIWGKSLAITTSSMDENVFIQYR
jgi:hypothetical protein